MCVNASHPIWQTLSSGGFSFWWCAVYSLWWVGPLVLLAGLAEIWSFHRLQRHGNRTSNYQLPRRGTNVLLVSVSCALVVVAIGLLTRFSPGWILWSMGLELKTLLSLFYMTPDGIQFVLDRLERIALATVMGWSAIVLIGIRLVMLSHAKPDATEEQWVPREEPKEIYPKIMLTLLHVIDEAGVRVQTANGKDNVLRMEITQFYFDREFYIDQSGRHIWIGPPPQEPQDWVGELSVSAKFDEAVQEFVVHGLHEHSLTGDDLVYSVASLEQSVNFSARMPRLLRFNQDDAMVELEMNFWMESDVGDG